MLDYLEHQEIRVKMVQKEKQELWAQGVSVGSKVREVVQANQELRGKPAN